MCGEGRECRDSTVISLNPPQILSYNSYGIQRSTEPEKNSLIGLVPRQICLGNYINRIVRMGAAVNRLIDNIHSITLIRETLQADNRQIPLTKRSRTVEEKKRLSPINVYQYLSDNFSGHYASFRICFGNLAYPYSSPTPFLYTGSNCYSVVFRLQNNFFTRSNLILCRLNSKLNIQELSVCFVIYRAF